VSQSNVSSNQSGIGNGLLGGTMASHLRNSYVKGESIVSNSPLGPTTTNVNLIYKPEGLKKAQDVKQ